MSPLPVLAELVRSGFVESRHTGSLVALDPNGQVLLTAGVPGAPVFPRSSSKPLQSVGMLRVGLDLEDDAALLAVTAASHSGEPRHLALVQALLARYELPLAALACPPDLPLSVPAAEQRLRAGLGPERLTHNCSGKHAGMLGACVSAGWPVEGYLGPESRLQRELTDAIADLTGEPPAAVGVDGCGAPVVAVSLTGLARALGRLVAAPPGSPERQVADAMRAHPEVVGGTGRDVTGLMTAVPGLLAKDGAEGVYVAALPGGPAVALKIDDGAGRGRVPVLVAALQALGVDAPGLAELAAQPVLGGGKPVGEVRASDLSHWRS